ncbi:MAG: homoserine dehydrogenase [Chloroflexota bacterium]
MASRAVVGLLGLGTVGGGVWQAYAGQIERLSELVGRPLHVKRALVRDLARPRPEVPAALLTAEPADVLGDPEIEIVVEVLGGEHPAYEWVKEALLAGKHVVTANKEMLARHGVELFTLARAQGLQLACEASVGGGIPIIAALRRELVANRIGSLRGIVNGTTNYILTAMDEQQRSFTDALAEAQALGYAEPDPTNDVEGYDARYKLAVLCGLAFSLWPHPEEIPCRGITQVTLADLAFAKSLGFAVKLLAAAQPAGAAVRASVQPTLVPLANPLAGVGGVFNAVQVQGDLVGEMLYYGRGAGPAPTASAILADVIAVARGEGAPLPLVPTRAAVLPAGDLLGRRYLRLAAAGGSVPEAIAAAGLELRQLIASGDEVAALVNVPDANALAACNGQLGERLRAVLPLAD